MQISVWTLICCQECCDVLSIPVTVLARQVLAEGKWPWKVHWIHPLFKNKGSPSNPLQYRGLHLTPIVSKVVERAIGRTLCGFLDISDAYGDSQWAFRPKRSCKTLLTVLVLPSVRRWASSSVTSRAPSTGSTACWCSSRRAATRTRGGPEGRGGDWAQPAPHTCFSAAWKRDWMMIPPRLPNKYVKKKEHVV